MAWSGGAAVYLMTRCFKGGEEEEQIHVHKYNFAASQPASQPTVSDCGAIIFVPPGDIAFVLFIFMDKKLISKKKIYI